MSGLQDNLSVSSSVSEESPTPSFVDHIDLNVIAFLARAIHKRTTSINVECTVNPLYKSGSFNIAWFIDFEGDVHWVLCTPQAEWSPWLEKRMWSDIGRPYIFFDCIEGTQLCKLWFNPRWFTEERHKKVFQSLVSCMMQLRALEFPSIGCLEYDPKTDSQIVGPLLPTHDNILEGNTSVRGPYNTTHAYLLDSISKQVSATSTVDRKTSLLLMRLFAGGLPDESPPFMLSMPDFGYQNIFVDEEGHVTGLVDWDDTKTCSRQGGYAMYPSWITRDWDPLMYGYCIPDEEDEQLIQPREELEEDSPQVLQAFRDEYLEAFEKADAVSAKYTRNSHIYEAIVGSVFCRGGILERLTEYVFGRRRTDDILSTYLLEEGLRAGQWLD